jgi:hypothetical protein
MTTKSRAKADIAASPPAPVEESECDRTLYQEMTQGRRLQRVAVENGSIVLQGTDEAQRRVHDAFGSESREFETYCLGHLLNILPENASADVTLPTNAAVEMLRAIAPRNELEAMLAIQMVASNHMAMTAMRRCNLTQHLDSRQLNGNLATKFSRTFIAQLEALDRHRRGGKQIVEHVHVNAGGQAVIAATVNAGNGG